MTKAYTALKIAFLSCFIAYSVVDADVVLKVTGDNVNLRAIGDGESEVVSQVSRGAILHADKFIGGDWIGISVPAGVAVWVYAELVKGDIVAVSKLSVRSGPGINYRTIGMLLKGEKVISHGTLNGWLKISAPANCRVWISSKYVELADSVVKKNAVKPIEKPIVMPLASQRTEVEGRKSEVDLVTPVLDPVKVVVVQDVVSMAKDKPIVQSVKELTLVEPKTVVALVSAPVAKSIVKPLKPMKPVVVEIEVVEVEKPVIVAPKPVLIEAKPMSQPVVAIIEQPPKEAIDESIAELVSMSATDELDKGAEEPVVELGSEVVLDPIPEVENIVLSSVSEVIPTPEIVVLPIITEDEVENIKPDVPVVVSFTEETVVVKQSTEDGAFGSAQGPTEVVIESVDVMGVEPEVVGVIEAGKYLSIDTNNIPADINLDSLVLSMSQGSEVTLTGKLKRAGRILRRRPSRYRLMGDAANCYVISENDNLNEFLGATVTVSGQSYWIQGVRDMVISINDIKTISDVPALP